MAVGEALHFESRPLGTDDDGVGGADGLCGAELLADFFVSKREADAPTCLAQLLGEGESLGAVGLIRNHEIELHRRVSLERGLLLRLGCRSFVEEFQQDGIPHPEADGRQVGGAVAQVGKKAVIATTTRNGAEIPLESKGLKDHPRVVCETAHHPEIGTDIVAEPACRQVGKERSKGRDLRLRDELLQGRNLDPEGLEQFSRFLGRHLLDAIDNRQELPCLLLGNAVTAHEIMPCRAVAQTDREVLCPQSEGAEQIDQKRDHLGIGGGRGVADEVAVELQELPQTPPLLALVAEAGADIEPTHRLRKITVPCRNHAGQSWGHLGAQSHGTLPLVGELVELAEDLPSAVLLPVELGRLEGRPVELHEPVTPGRLAPPPDQIVSPGKITREEVAEAWKGLHGLWKVVGLPLEKSSPEYGRDPLSTIPDRMA